MTPTAPISPNDQQFGAGPGMLKNVVQGSIAATVAATITACGAALAASEYYHGDPLSVAVITLGKAAAASVVVGGAVFALIREK